MATIEGTLETAAKHVQRLIQHYQIVDDEWPIMQQESPSIYAVLEEIESMKHETVEAAQKHCRRGIMNYERMFMRRASRRGK